MTKKEILEMTGLSESDFYKKYPNKESFEKDFQKYKYGGIHIKPENKGKFTAWAKSHGMGVQEAASHVMSNKEDYSSTIVKRANFAKNASKWNHQYGGMLKYEKGGKPPTTGEDIAAIGIPIALFGASQILAAARRRKLNKEFESKRESGKTQFDNKKDYRDSVNITDYEFGKKSLLNGYMNGGNVQKLSKTNVLFKGNSHDNGGIKEPVVNGGKLKGVEVEGNETMSTADGNKFVFSHNLGFAQQHKPLARAIGKIENRLKSNPNDPISKRTLNTLKQREEELKVRQEQTKEAMGIPNDLGSMQMENGGEIKRYALGGLEMLSPIAGLAMKAFGNKSKPKNTAQPNGITAGQQMNMQLNPGGAPPTPAAYNSTAQNYPQQSGASSGMNMQSPMIGAAGTMMNRGNINAGDVGMGMFGKIGFKDGGAINRKDGVYIDRGEVMRYPLAMGGNAGGPPRPEFPYKNLKDFSEPRTKTGQLKQWYNLSDFDKEGKYLNDYIKFNDKDSVWVNKYGSVKEIKKQDELHNELRGQYENWKKRSETYTEPEKEICDASKNKKRECGNMKGVQGLFNMFEGIQENLDRVGGGKNRFGGKKKVGKVMYYEQGGKIKYYEGGLTNPTPTSVDLRQDTSKLYSTYGVFGGDNRIGGIGNKGGLNVPSSIIYDVNHPNYPMTTGGERTIEVLDRYNRLNPNRLKVLAKPGIQRTPSQIANLKKEGLLKNGGLFKAEWGLDSITNPTTVIGNFTNAVSQAPTGLENVNWGKGTFLDQAKPVPQLRTQENAEPFTVGAPTPNSTDTEITGLNTSNMSKYVDKPIIGKASKPSSFNLTKVGDILSKGKDLAPYLGVVKNMGLSKKYGKLSTPEQSLLSPMTLNRVNYDNLRNEADMQRREANQLITRDLTNSATAAAARANLYGQSTREKNKINQQETLANTELANQEKTANLEIARSNSQTALDNELRKYNQKIAGITQESSNWNNLSDIYQQQQRDKSLMGLEGRKLDILKEDAKRGTYDANTKKYVANEPYAKKEEERKKYGGILKKSVMRITKRKK
jgi:hypothetical protein